MASLLARLGFVIAARRVGARVDLRASIKNPHNIRIGARTKILRDAALDGSRRGPGIDLGSGVTINPLAQVQGGAGGIRIGDGSEINNFCFINGDGCIEIGSNVLIGPHVIIVSALHGFSDPRVPIKHQASVPAPVVVEDDVWIGGGAVVLPGVRIGRGSVVGAGAVVSRSCDPGSVMLGVPARCMRYREGFGAPAD